MVESARIASPRAERFDRQQELAVIFSMMALSCDERGLSLHAGFPERASLFVHL